MKFVTDCLPPALCAAWAAVLDLPGPYANDLPPNLTRGVLSLWERFTKERSVGSSVYMDQADERRAYLAYYFPVNMAKVLSLLKEMPQPETSPSPCRSLRVLDVGCGPGTGALAVLDWSRSCVALSGRPLQVVAIDTSPHALRESARLWEAYRSLVRSDAATLTAVQADIQRPGFKTDSRYCNLSYDLIIVANTLNELFQDRPDPIALRAGLVRRLLDLLDQHGTLMIIEPALRATSRSLHLVRNTVLAESGCNVYSPCLHEKPCPALVNNSDWCHEERPWNPPPIVGMIDRQVGFIKDSLKFSYLMLRKDGAHIVRREPGLYRVVSELRRMKGERRVWLCHEAGRPQVGRLDRERSPVNAWFDDWHRGAIVRVGDLAQGTTSRSEGSLARIRKTTAVELVRPVCPTMTDE